MQSLKVNDVLENQPVIIRHLSKKTGQNNKDYYALQISFGLKSYDAKIWNVESDLSDDIKPGVIAVISGVVKDFKGSLQIHVSKLEKLENPTDDMLKSLTPDCGVSESLLQEKLYNYISTVSDPKLNTLLLTLFDTKELKENFFKKPAGAEIHHAYLGGLAQHTLEVTEMVAKYCEIFPRLNYDIAITAALLHDIGKVAELSGFPENKYTTRGRMLGHITIGVEMLHDCIKSLDTEFPAHLRTELEHCILSHHGSQEAGSPIVPVTLEALAVHSADKTSADLNGFILAIDRDGNTGDWTDYNLTYKRCIKK